MTNKLTTEQRTEVGVVSKTIRVEYEFEEHPDFTIIEMIPHMVDYIAQEVSE